MQPEALAENAIRSAVQATGTHYQRELSTLIEHAARSPIGRADAASILNLDASGALVYRVLQAGVELGLFERSGASRAARYGITAHLRRHLLSQYMQRPVTERAAREYNHAWLDSYVPNESLLLSSAARSALTGFTRSAKTSIGTLSPYAAHEFLIDISFASSRLEQNRYTMAETRELVENGAIAPGATAAETQMVLNHVHAARYIVNQTIGLDHAAPHDKLDISTMTVRELHALLSDRLLKRQDLCGTLRDHSVEISSSTYTPPKSLFEIQPIFETICRKAAEIRDPYEQSFFLLANLPYLQPFSDCNKRTARLAANVPLLRAGLPPISWLGVDEDTYINAILSVYELQETDALEDLFVDIVVSSGERLATQIRTGPARQRLQSQYEREITECVRAHIRESVPYQRIPTPTEMSPRDKLVFIAMVKSAVKDVLANPLMGVVHELRVRDIMNSHAYQAMCSEQSLAAMRSRARQKPPG